MTDENKQNVDEKTVRVEVDIPSNPALDGNVANDNRTADNSGQEWQSCCCRCSYIVGAKMFAYLGVCAHVQGH